MNFRMLLLAVLLLFTAACSEQLDPTEPDGAYNVYRNALFAGDAETVWTLLSPSSQQYFDDQYARLKQMDEQIARYLPPTDHKLARRQAGSILTDELEDGHGLFLKVFTPKTMKVTEAHQVGAILNEIQVTEDGKFAKLKTNAGTEYRLEKMADENWKVGIIGENSAFTSAMGWLNANEEALEQTVTDLIEEETTRREAIIAELMKPNE